MPNKPISIEFTAETDKYEKGLKDAERATEKLGDEIEDLSKSSGKAARGVSDDFDRLGDSAADAGSEVGDEFKQNLGQSLASGDMSALLTDTLGGLVASLKGPVGLAGAAIAGVAPIVPASPTPFTPSGLTGEGVSVRSSSKSGTCDARGNA